MSDTQLVVLSLPSEESATDLVRQLDAIDKLDANVKIVDVAIAVRDRRGKPKLKQLKVAGATKGGFFGAIGGAFAGLASLFRDSGIDDDMMRRTAQDLAPGEVALFLLYSGDWRRSSAVLQDALAAHGIRYGGRNMPDTMVAARARPASDRAVSTGQSDAGEDFAEDTAPAAPADVGSTTPSATPEQEYFEPEFEGESEFDAESAYVVDADLMVESEPVFGEDSVEEYAVEEYAAEEFTGEDPVANAARAAMIAAAANETRAADAAVYAGTVEALSEATGAAGASDTRQGVELLDASAQVGEAGASMGLLSLERKTSGFEIGHIAGELAQIGREVGARHMPILSALLASRSGALQRIAAEMIASAASARELAQALDATGSVVGELGAAEVDEGAARLAAASLLAAHAADVGAGGLPHKK